MLRLQVKYMILHVQIWGWCIMLGIFAACSRSCDKSIIAEDRDAVRVDSLGRQDTMSGWGSKNSSNVHRKSFEWRSSKCQPRIAYSKGGSAAEGRYPKPQFDEYLYNLLECSKHEIGLIYRECDSLDIGASGEIVYNPFELKELSIDGFIKKYADMLREGEVHYEEGSCEPLDGRLGRWRKGIFRYKGSWVKIIEYERACFPADASELAEYRFSEPLLFYVLGGRIENAEWVLYGGIKVGMGKKEFFQTLFDGCNTYSLEDIRVVNLADIFGEYIEIRFTFAGDTLKVIELLEL